MTRNRANGLASRRAVVERGLALVQQGGRHRASIGAIARALGMSKSAVHAHFGSKGALDAALVEEAQRRFDRAVVGPASAAPPGLARLAALCEAFLEFATDPTPRLTPAHRALGRGLGAAAEARVRTWGDAWQQQLERAATDGRSRGELLPSSDPTQVAFEVGAVLDAAARLMDTVPATDVRRRARAAIERTLVMWAAPRA